MEILTWAVGILVTLNSLALGFIFSRLWSHVTQCGMDRRHVDARLSTLEGDMNRAKEDIGTHDRGMRGEIHEIAQMVNTHELKISLMERE